MSGHDDHGHHPSYIKVYFILLVLFIVSVAGPELAPIIFGEGQEGLAKGFVLFTAFGIAFVKAYYVIAYFMHLKFEVKYVNYMLATTVVFMLLFFSGVAADVMKHEGHNWTNLAAQTEVERALAEISARDEAANAEYANLAADPRSIKEWKKVGHEKYQAPVEAAMLNVVKLTKSGNSGAHLFRHTGETVAQKTKRKATEAKLAVEFKKLQAEPVEVPKPDAALVAKGAAYYKTSQCVGCHSINGDKVVGPSFKGLPNRVFYGHVSGKNGPELTVKRADLAYFNASINNPAEVIVKGYQNQMPKITVSDQDRKALWAYIQSL
ncbi:MAG: cytochrome C oxidase subunit IV family protein [Bradymonadia bacterium]